MPQRRFANEEQRQAALHGLRQRGLDARAELHSDGTRTRSGSAGVGDGEQLSSRIPRPSPNVGGHLLQVMDPTWTPDPFEQSSRTNFGSTRGGAPPPRQPLRRTDTNLNRRESAASSGLEVMVQSEVAGTWRTSVRSSISPNRFRRTGRQGMGRAERISDLTDVHRESQPLYRDPDDRSEVAGWH